MLFSANSCRLRPSRHQPYRSIAKNWSLFLGRHRELTLRRSPFQLSATALETDGSPVLCPISLVSEHCVVVRR
jgi:hypothetical protein